MKFAAIADVHGNCVAVEAVRADIAAIGITEVMNLGDHVSGPLESRRTADLLIERGFPSIRGDQDRLLVELSLAGPRASDRNDYKQLDRKHLDWLAGLQPTLVYRDNVFLCHGSPRSDTACWLDRVTEDASLQASAIEEIEAEATGIAASLILCGHTHIPRVVRLRDGRLVVNPGSVGCPGYESHKPVFLRVQTGTPDACYTILERTELGWSATFRYVPYDHMSMAEMARRRGFAAWASALATGWIR
jgi:predicted phosphodiesterase